MSGPAVVMMIRHGEKPADAPAKPPPHGVDHLGRHSDHSLLPRGWQRAGALATILGGHEPGLPRPQSVFAPDYGSATAVHRTTQTVTPLAQRWGLAVQTPVAKGHEPHLVKDFLGPAQGVVLVCWEHHHLPPLAQAFAQQVGLRQQELPDAARFWPEDDFWTVLVFTRDEDGRYTVTATSQAALEGDPPR